MYLGSENDLFEFYFIPEVGNLRLKTGHDDLVNYFLYH
jgi:hypothetical protein